MRKLLEIPEKYYKTKSEEMIKVEQDESYLRDHFAGLAMQAEIIRNQSGYDPKQLSEFSYYIADAMLKARKETSNV